MTYTTLEIFQMKDIQDIIYGYKKEFEEYEAKKKENKMKHILRCKGYSPCADCKLMTDSKYRIFKQSCMMIKKGYCVGIWDSEMTSNNMFIRTFHIHHSDIKKICESCCWVRRFN